MVEAYVPDITSYCNLWLALTCFAVKQPQSFDPINTNEEDNEESTDSEVRARGIIKILARDLIKVFNGNKRWKATELNLGEAANISIAISSL